MCFGHSKLYTKWLILSELCRRDGWKNNALKGWWEAKLDGLTLTEQRFIICGSHQPPKDTPVAICGRIGFFGLIISLLDHQRRWLEFTVSKAQRLDSLLGKIIRIKWWRQSATKTIPFYGQDKMPLGRKSGGAGNAIASEGFIFNSLGHRMHKGLV